jgi:acetyl coenzyme A synthetase (ADP forming)-like protein
MGVLLEYHFTIVLSSLFNPRSVAVVGASQNPRKVGHAILNNLLRYGFGGKIYPVNPGHGMILGMKAVGSVLDIGEGLDLAVIAIPAALVPGALRECVEKGVSSAVIISAGFRESGEGGMALEAEVREIVRGSGIRILGPNCLGVINTSAGLNATFAAGMLPRGRLSFFSQSGALGIAILDWAIGNRIGFSKFISLGNKTDLNETDFVEYFIRDEDTDIILGYIEDVVDGKRFLEVAKRASKVKPIILVKSGGTQAGARAASSHTGALAGSETAFNSAFRQTGVIRAEGVEDLFETAKAFSSKKLPAGNRLLIVTNAGGPGIIAADMSEKLGLNLPTLSKETTAVLASLLPRNASLYNPVDIIGDAGSERYSAVLEHTLDEPNIDGFLIILTPQATIDVEETAKAVIEAADRTDRPFITSFMGEERVRTSIEMMKSASIPNFSYPEPAVRAFGKLRDYRIWREKRESFPPELNADRDTVAQKIREAREKGLYQFAEDDSRGILSCYGFSFPRKRLVTSAGEAARAASAMGFPVVMKISSPDILHKTDVGGVKTGVRSAREARETFGEITMNAKRFMPSAFINGITVYETVRPGREVIVGVTYDRTFGHMVMFGLGGIYVEVLKDVSFRIVPVTPDDAYEMVREIRAFPLLKGTRGERPADTDAIVESILKVSRIVRDFPEIQEIDINPLVALEEGATALDARIILSK